MWFEDKDKIGRKGIPWIIERDKTLLLVIDLQNDFVEEGAILEVPAARKQIPKVKRLIETCRELNVPVIYTAIVHKSPNLAPRHYELFPFLKNRAYRPGTRGIEIYHEIAPRPDEIIVEKVNYSAFNGTNLDLVIHSAKGLGLTDTLILVGTVTNVCVESTARDAFDRNYKVVLVSDACSAFDSELHNATLKNVAYGLGRVMTCDEAIKALKEGEA